MPVPSARTEAGCPARVEVQVAAPEAAVRADARAVRRLPVPCARAAAGCRAPAEVPVAAPVAAVQADARAVRLLPVPCARTAAGCPAPAAVRVVARAAHRLRVRSVRTADGSPAPAAVQAVAPVARRSLAPCARAVDGFLAVLVAARHLEAAPAASAIPPWPAGSAAMAGGSRQTLAAFRNRQLNQPRLSRSRPYGRNEVHLDWRRWLA